MRLRIFLGVGLTVASVFAAWSWMRPYEWSSDPAAAFRVVGVEVRKDHDFYWVKPHLRVVEGRSHDLMKPVILRVKDGTTYEPADTTLAGDESNGTTDIWFKFWIEAEDLAKPLELRLNDGTLVLKKNAGTPRLGASGVEFFVTNRW